MSLLKGQKCWLAQQNGDKQIVRWHAIYGQRTLRDHFAHVAFYHYWHEEASRERSNLVAVFVYIQIVKVHDNTFYRWSFMFNPHTCRSCLREGLASIRPSKGLTSRMYWASVGRPPRWRGWTNRSVVIQIIVLNKSFLPIVFSYQFAVLACYNYILARVTLDSGKNLAGQ